MNTAEYIEHLSKPAIDLFPPSDDGLCHGGIRLKYQASDHFNKRTVAVFECDRCHQNFTAQESWSVKSKSHN